MTIIAANSVTKRYISALRNDNDEVVRTENGLVLGSSSNIGVQFAETLTLAFITGSAARRALVPRPLAVSPGTRWAAVLLLVAAAASGVTNWAPIRAEGLGQPLAELV
jgi:hypothetical protein